MPGGRGRGRTAQATVCIGPSSWEWSFDSASGWFLQHQSAGSLFATRGRVLFSFARTARRSRNRVFATRARDYIRCFTQQWRSVKCVMRRNTHANGSKLRLPHGVGAEAPRAQRNEADAGASGQRPSGHTGRRVLGTQASELGPRNAAPTSASSAPTTPRTSPASPGGRRGPCRSSAPTSSRR